MSPVDSRVFTRLSPSEPPGRESSLTVISGLAALKASIIALALATSVSVLPWRNVIVTAPAEPPAPPSSLLPRLPALQPAANSTLAVAMATSAAWRGPDLLKLMEPPNLETERDLRAGHA